MASAAEPVRFRWVLAAVSMALCCVQIDYFAIESRIAADGSRAEQHPNRPAVGDQRLLAHPCAFMVPAGRIGDIFGRRRALLAGVALFGLASAVCAPAPSAILVVACRALQLRNWVVHLGI
jgi:hypothetical protein